jgi:hypothetical protein
MRVAALVLVMLLAAAAFGQSVSIPEGLIVPQVALGGPADGVNYVTLVQFVNNNSATITGRLTLLSDSGTALSAKFDGQGPQPSLDLTLASGEARQIQITVDGEVTVGSMSLNFSPAAALTTVILQFKVGATVLSEVGVDAVDPSFNFIDATDFPAETDTNLGLNTGIAIANRTAATSYVLARLWDAGTGAVAASTIIQLPPNGHISKFVTELFSNVQTISQTRAKLSLDSCLTASCNVAPGAGFVATAIRVNGDQFTTIPVMERVSSGNAERVLPQVAFGGPANGLNMKTVLYLTTNVPTGIFGTADIFDDNGNPLPVSADNGSPSASITFTVPGNRVSRIVLSGDQTLRSGWIRLKLPGTAHLIANAVFQTFNGTTLASEASVLESPQIKQGLIYVKAGSGASNVGVAFANSASEADTIIVDLFDRSGSVADKREITLPPNGHLARFVTELFPQIASAGDFDGALSIHSSASFSALALRLSGDKVASLPVAEIGMYRPSITALRITRTQRSPAQVNFDIDVIDSDSDVATSASTAVNAAVLMDFGNNITPTGFITIDGSAVLNRTTGTLSGTFQPNVTGIPSGFSAIFFIQIQDAAGNPSNIVAAQPKF